MQLKLKVCAIVKQIDIMLLLSSAILTWTTNYECGFQNEES